jgi:hypothetical protein
MPVQSERAAARSQAHSSGRRRSDTRATEPARRRRNGSASEPGSSGRGQVAHESSPAQISADGSPKADPGIAAFIAFFAAVLVIVVAVVVAGAVDRWWVLAPVMLVDFAVVFGVISIINHLLADDGDPFA